MGDWCGPCPTPNRTKTGARTNKSRIWRVRKERRKNKGSGVPLDSSLLMGDPFVFRGMPPVRRAMTPLVRSLALFPRDQSELADASIRFPALKYNCAKFLRII